MRICALDLGTNTGFAVGIKGVNDELGHSLERVGTWTLATDKEIRESGKNRMRRRQDPRVTMLWNHLTQTHAQSNLDWIVFEDVQFASSTQQTQLWSSFRGCLWTFSFLYHINIECLATGKLKMFATGSGSADKTWMASALVRNHPTLFTLDAQRQVTYRFGEVGNILDDNAVDATHLLLWAMKTFRKTN